MGTIIHMQTEQVDETARRLLYGATDLLDILDDAGHQAGRLRSAWHGGRSDRSIANLEDALRNLRTTARSLDDLSRRVTQEVQEWEAVDQDGFSLKKYIAGDPWSVIKDAARLGVAGSFALFLTTSAKLPGEIVFHAPPIFNAIGKNVGKIFGKDAGLLFGGRNLRAFMGLNKMTNHIKPANLPKAMLLANVAIDVVPQLIDDYRQYGFTDRFTSAAIVDTIVKGAIAVGGALIVTALVTAFVGLIPITGPTSLLIAGGVSLVSTVGTSIAMERLTTPLWDLFKSSGWRDGAIEELLRAKNADQNLRKALLQVGADKVKNAFSGIINSLTPQPSPSGS